MIPKKIKINDKLFELEVKPMTGDNFQGWWSYVYSGKEKSNDYDVGNETDGYIPYVSDGHSRYYLVSCAPNKEDAYTDMTEKVSNAIGYEERTIENFDNDLADLDYESLL